MRLLLDTCVIIDWLTDADQKFAFYRSQGLNLIEY